MSRPNLTVVPDPDTAADPGGGGGDDGVEGRLRGLEQQVMEIRVLLAHLPTKANLEEIKTLIAERETRLLKWLVGTVIAAAALGAALARTFF